MSISVRQARRGVSIRLTGPDAERVLRFIAAALQPQGAGKALEGLPNRSKPQGRADGATQGSSVHIALSSPEAP